MIGNLIQTGPGDWLMEIRDGNWHATVHANHPGILHAMLGGIREGAVLIVTDSVTPRIGDAERDACIDKLQRHFTEGRLRTEEMEDRIGRAAAAMTQPELDALLLDLPALREIAARDEHNERLMLPEKPPAIPWRVKALWTAPVVALAALAIAMLIVALVAG